MKTITLPADTEHLYLDEVAHLIADYFNPEGPSDPGGALYDLCKIQAENEIHQAAKDGSLSVKHPSTHGPFPLELGLKRAVVLVPAAVAYLAAREITMLIEAPKQEAEATVPVLTAQMQRSETKEQRQDRRLLTCETAGLVMPKSSAGRLPDGVGDIAGSEKITRQAYAADIKAALKRRESAKREGVTMHRA